MKSRQHFYAINSCRISCPPQHRHFISPPLSTQMPCISKVPQNTKGAAGCCKVRSILQQRRRPIILDCDQFTFAVNFFQDEAIAIFTYIDNLRKVRQNERRIPKEKVRPKPQKPRNVARSCEAPSLPRSMKTVSSRFEPVTNRFSPTPLPLPCLLP